MSLVDPSAIRNARKAGDTLDENIEQIRKIARLTNGIYLVRGLIDGSIQPDAFISELLRLGPLTLPKIQAMNLADSKKGLEAMQKFLNDVKVTDLEEKAEKRYLVFDAFRKDTKDIGDIGSLAGLDDYKKELETLKALVIDWKKIDALKSAAISFLEKADDLSKPFNADKAFSYLDDMKPKVEALKKAAEEVGQFPKFEKIPGSDKILEPISKATKGITEIASKRKPLHREPEDVSADKSYYAKIGTFKNLKSTSTDDENNIKYVLSIFENRIQTPVSFAYTSGFINGVSDLNEISKDLEDGKIKVLVSDPDSLLKALEPLKPIGETAEAVENTFGSSIERMKALEFYLSQRKSVVEFSDKTGSLVIAMEKVYGCGFSNLGLVSSLEEVKNLLNEARDLKTKMDSFSKIIDVVNLLLGHPEHFQYISGQLGLVDKSKKEAFEGIQNMLVTSFHFKIVNEALKGSRSSFEKASQISQDPDMSKLATSILQKFPNIDSFQKDAAGHVTFFKCLQGIEDVELIPEGIQKIQSFRQIDSKPVEDGIHAVEDVGKAVKEFGKLTDNVNALPQMKNSLNPETKALEQLQNPSEHSMTIGGAARGIIAMKSAFDQKSIFDMVKSHSNLVADEMTNSKNLPAADVDNLNKLKSIPELFDALESWAKETNLSDPGKLKDYSVIFLNAQKVTGVEDLKKIRDSVEVLENLVQDPVKKKNLNGLKNALDGLGEMKFSNYKKQFGDADGTLEKLDLFFAQYSYELHPTTEYIEPSTSTLEATSLSPTTVLEISTTTILTSTAPVLFPVYGYVIIVGIVSVGIAAGSVVYCWLRGLCCFSITLKEAVVHKKPAKPRKLKVVPTGTDFENKNDQNQKIVSAKKKKLRLVTLERPIVIEQEKRICELAQELKKELNKETSLRVTRCDLTFDAGETFLAEVFRQLIKYQRQELGVNSDFLEDGTLDKFAKYIFDEVQSANPKKESVFPSDIQVQNRVQTFLIDETRAYLRQEFFNRCFFKNSYLNCNRFVMPNGQTFFMTETPTSFSNRGNQIRKTVDKFWYMVAQTDCQAIVMLCSGDQELSCLPKYKNLQDDKCEQGITRYYPKDENEVYYQDTTDHNKFTVRCEKKVQLSRTLVHRTLILRYSETPEPQNKRSNFVKDIRPVDTTTLTEATKEATKDESTKTTGEDELQQYLAEERMKAEMAELAQQFRGESVDVKSIYRRIDHYVFMGYPKDSSPETTDDLVDVIEKTKNLKNVVVHCSDGVGRTGAFVCAALARQTLGNKVVERMNPQIDFVHMINEVRATRNGAVTQYKDVAHIMMLLVDSGYYTSEEDKKKNINLKWRKRQYECRYERFRTSYLRILNPKVKLASEKEVEVKKPKKKQKKDKKQEVRIPIDEGLDVDSTQEDMPEDPTQEDN